MTGDFNGRTGTANDFIANDCGSFTPLHNEYRVDLSIKPRVREDECHKTCTRGQRLLDLCISSQLRILNGRMLGDPRGKFTYHGPQGSSVIDYLSECC